jgi:Tfp pilus assembly protein PilX
MRKKQDTRNKKQGFTLFLAMVVTATLLLVAAGVATIAVRQSLIANAGKESQIAFYAADTGMECAIFWDVMNPAGNNSAFATSTGTMINCNRNASNTNNEWVVGGSLQSVFTMTFNPDPFCAIVTVTKQSNGATLIESRGYNTCNTSNPRRVERAVRARY